jgi:CRISPR-associated exonuclease Cas4
MTLGHVALVLILVGFALLWLSRQGRRRMGLPGGRVIYEDMGNGSHRNALISRQHGLSGRPDYLVKTRGGLVPVEVKTGRAPAQPHQGHVMQLAAYCLLVEETYGQRPSHGIIRYADRVFHVDYTPDLEARLLKTLELMRADLAATTVARSHTQPARCRRCGYRDVCGQALVQ